MSTPDIIDSELTYKLWIHDLNNTFKSRFIKQMTLLLSRWHLQLFHSYRQWKKNKDKDKEINSSSFSSSYSSLVGVLFANSVKWRRCHLRPYRQCHLRPYQQCHLRPHFSRCFLRPSPSCPLFRRVARKAQRTRVESSEENIRGKSHSFTANMISTSKLIFAEV